MARKKAQGKAKKRVKRTIPHGQVHIKSTFNNTIVSATDNEGNVIAWSSGGTKGFKGSKKSTPFAAQQAARDVVRACQDMGMRRVDILTKGPGSGRESAIRACMASGLEVGSIKDVSPVPHNGCRPRKRRRV
jgi:small subunit ribosomal protein S11